MRYIVNFSAGLTSWEALDRAITQKGRENVEAWFADVKGHGNDDNPHAGEDQDAYRFIEDTERYFGITIRRLVEGRDIWQVMNDRRFMVMMAGSRRIAPCSQDLKGGPLDRALAEYSPDEVTLVVGMDWSEPHRMRDLEAIKAPYRIWFPLAERPFMDKCHIADKLERIGIKPPPAV